MTDSADNSTNKSKNNDAVLCHLIGLAGLVFPFGSVLGPLILWLVKKDESPEVDVHGKEALNFGISYFIYFTVSFLLCFILVGFFLLPIATIAYFVLMIMAAVKVSNGEEFRYPYIFRFVN
jgi:uncharacterized Tic20 family protein